MRRTLAILAVLILALMPTVVFASPDLSTLTTTDSYSEGISDSTSPPGQHWIAVHSSETGWVATNAGWEYDFYEIDDLPEAGTIISVWVIIQIKSADVPDQASAGAVIRSCGTTEKSPGYTASTETYITKTWMMNTNPCNGGAPWTWANVQDLRAGVGLRSCLSGSASMTLCRMVSVKVNYSPLLAPTDFTLAESGEDVDIAWTMGAEADSTLIMRQTGHYPTDTVDGVQVFRNVGTSYTDESVNLEDTEYYYRAWSLNAEEGISEDYAEGMIGGHSMLTVGVIILALGLTVASYFIRSGMLYAACIPIWLFFTVYMYNVDWGVNTYLPTAIAFFGAIMMVILVATTAMHYIGNRSSEPTYDEEKAANAAKIYKITHKKQPWE